MSKPSIITPKPHWMWCDRCRSYVMPIEDSYGKQCPTRHFSTLTETKPCGGQIDSSRQFCSCGQDAVTCQICAKQVCGNNVVWMEPVPGTTREGNVCNSCKQKAINSVNHPRIVDGGAK